MDSKLRWNGQMSFTCDNRGLQSTFDATPEFGGQNSGPTPKEMVLNAMCACSAMDVVSIAKKMHLPLKTLKMEAHADKTATIPSYFSLVQLNYLIEGEMDREKIIKCVVLSMTKYCGVSFMISKACPINYEIFLNGQSIYKDRAQFTVEVI